MTLRTVCPQCSQEIALRPDCIAFLPHGRSAEGRYGFVCPHCEAVVLKPANHVVQRMLSLAGACMAGPPEPTARAAACGAPRFTADDLIDFHEMLASDSWLDRLL